MGKPNYLRRWVGATSGALVGGLVGNVPGAVYGARAGYNMAARRDEEENFGGQNLPQNTRSMVTATPTRRRRLSTSSFLFTPGSRRSTGSRYVVRTPVASRRYRKSRRFRKMTSTKTTKKTYRRKNYKKSKRRKLKKKAMIDKSKTLGFNIRTETYGEISDDHCIYLRHSSWNRAVLTRVIMGALIRKLFKKAGFDIGEVNSVIPGLGTLGSLNVYRILYWHFNPLTNANTEEVYTTVANETLQNMASSTGFTDMYDHLLDYMGNASQDEPHSLMLQVQDSTDLTSTYKTAATLNLQDEVIHLMITSRVRFQNRTLNPANSSDIEVVNNQPLMGRCITLKNADARTKFAKLSAPTNVFVNGTSETGLDINGSSAKDAIWQEPPTKGIFLNAISQMPISIGPGETQQIMLKYSYYGKFGSQFRKMRPSAAADGNFSGLVGRQQILALEEAIRTTNANTVKIGYEREYTAGCWFTTKKPVYHSSDFTVGDATNYP